ncbi:MAG: shikimate kinase [Chitinophagaceae bacterium]
MFFFLIGLMGSGKTYWGNILSKKKKLVFFDIDKLVEEDLKMSIADIFLNYGEDFFRRKETQILNNIISKTENAIIATGGGTPCFCNNIELMNQTGITIFLNESVSVISNRVTQTKEARPLIANLKDSEINIALENLLLKRLPTYSQCKYQLNIGDITEYNLLKIINQYA